MKNNKNIYIIILIIAILLIAYLIYGYYQKSTFELKNPIATMEIEDYGIVKIELYPEMAPNTVRNFIELINSGYYNGLTFHRVEDSLIQGGDKEGTGAGKTDYTIPGEFELNGFKENTLKFTRGTLGLARADYTMYYYYTGDSSYLKMGYNSGCSQFFIMAKDEENFDGNYCAFGKVIEGLDIIDEITKIEKTVEVDEETGESEETSTPVNPPIIKSITVDTFGINYKAPTKLVVED
ncbi:MAG: peptidylprolyl isomerase [Clostridia bacterium]